MPWKRRKHGSHRQRGKAFYQKDDPRLLARRRAINDQKFAEKYTKHHEKKGSFIRLISYAKKEDAELEVAKMKEKLEGTSHAERTDIRIVKLKGGEALDRFRSDPNHKYVKVPYRYEVREY